MIDLKPFETVTFRTMGEDLTSAQRDFLGVVFDHTVEAAPSEAVEVARREGRYALAAKLQLLPIGMVKFQAITFLNQPEEGISLSTHAYASLVRSSTSQVPVAEYSVITGPGKEGTYAGLGMGNEESAKVDDVELQRFVDTVNRLEEAGDLTLIPPAPSE